MMPSHELRGGRLAETEISVKPVTEEEKALSRLNQGFRFSKAQQILRLLKDQDELNKRFRECALLDPEDENAEGQAKQQGDPDSWSLEEEQQSEGGGSDESQHEAERRAARLVALRKHRNSIDPGRCKTSMGFYNEAEVTEIPYDTDSDNVAGLELDSAASTPRGGPYPVLSARQPNQQMYGAGMAAGGRGGNSRLRVYRLKMEEGDMNVRELALPEECVVQSARSTRPKTSLANPPTRGRYYRQQPHPEAKQKHHSHHQHNHHQQHHHHHNANHHSNHTQHHFQQRGVGETRQAIISRLDPHHPMAVRPFLESEEAVRGMSPATPQPSTPRGTSRAQGNGQYIHHTEVTLFDMAPKEVSRSKRNGGGATGMVRSSSFTDHGSKGTRVVPANRTLLSVDSSPLQPSPGGEEPSSSRRPKSSRVKKRVGEMSRGTVSTSMHVISDGRAHPLTVMKLPPLETAVNKGGSGRDLVCVGKD